LGFYAQPRFSGSIRNRGWQSPVGRRAFLDPGRNGALAQAAVPCGVVWLAFGAGVQRMLRSERALRAFNVVMGGLLVASVVLFIL
jgi:hypothetical protein